MWDWLKSITTPATWGGAGAGLTGAWTNIDWLAITGVVVAVGSFLVNWYFRREDNRREEEKWQMEKAERQEKLKANRGI